MPETGRRGRKRGETLGSTATRASGAEAPPTAKSLLIMPVIGIGSELEDAELAWATLS